MLETIVRLAHSMNTKVFRSKVAVDTTYDVLSEATANVGATAVLASMLSVFIYSAFITAVNIGNGDTLIQAMSKFEYPLLAWVFAIESIAILVVAAYWLFEVAPAYLERKCNYLLPDDIRSANIPSDLNYNEKALVEGQWFTRLVRSVHSINTKTFRSRSDVYTTDDVFNELIWRVLLLSLAASHGFVSALMVKSIFSGHSFFKAFLMLSLLNKVIFWFGSAYIAGKLCRYVVGSAFFRLRLSLTRPLPEDLVTEKKTRNQGDDNGL